MFVLVDFDKIFVVVIKDLDKVDNLFKNNFLKNMNTLIKVNLFAEQALLVVVDIHRNHTLQNVQISF